MNHHPGGTGGVDVELGSDAPGCHRPIPGTDDEPAPPVATAGLYARQGHLTGDLPTIGTLDAEAATGETRSFDPYGLLGCSGVHGTFDFDTSPVEGTVTTTRSTSSSASRTSPT